MRSLIAGHAGLIAGHAPVVLMFHGRKLNNPITRIHERASRIVYKNFESSIDELHV